ncbi:MAG: ribosome maturation factor RimM [Marmoricola sp.]
MSTVEVAVARIAKAHGVKGEVALDMLTDEPERRFEIDEVYAAKRPRTPDQRLTLESGRWHQGRLLARFVEIPDRNAAEAARGLILYVEVDADELPEDAEEFYDHQLIGLRAITVEGNEVGEVADVRHGAGQDLLVIETAKGEVLVPFVSAIVPEIDLAAGSLTIADRPGLLDPEAAD